MAGLTLFSSAKGSDMLAKLVVFPWGELVAALLMISEGLALIPGIPANGILDGVIKVLKAIKSKIS
jgi:hypothetical protein